MEKPMGRSRKDTTQEAKSETSGKVRFSVQFDKRIKNLICTTGAYFGSANQALEAAALAFCTMPDEEKVRLLKRRVAFLAGK
jgi:predicted lipoprotein